MSESMRKLKNHKIISLRLRDKICMFQRDYDVIGKEDEYSVAHWEAQYHWLTF